MDSNTAKIIAFVGLPGSGKGTCTDYLHETYDWPIVHFGKMVYEEVERRGLNIVKDETFVREDMRKQEGKDVLAKHAARKILHLTTEGDKVIVIDGLYSWTEYKYLAAEFSDRLIVIAIAAPKKLRHERAINRKDSHRQYTLEQLIEREYKEIENIEKGGPIAYADYTIVNDSTPEEMIDKLTDILRLEHAL
jgi:dephospho-CoA kinase